MNPLISIIVPVYNIEKYVKKCIQSIINQTYKKLEIIIIDDGSTDNSGKRCDEFKCIDSRIKVFHTKNYGLSDARNFGITKATGEFIAFIDGDDYLETKYIEYMYNEQLSTNADIVVCGYYEKKAAEQKNKVSFETKNISGRQAAIELLTKQRDYDIVAWNKLYRRKLFINHKITYPSRKVHEDNLTTYKLYYVASKISYIRDALYIYVRRNDSIMGKTKRLTNLQIKEQAAIEAIDFFFKDKYLQNAARIALLLAKFAFLDASIQNIINGEYIRKEIEWINENKTKYKTNPFLNNKLKFYLHLISIANGYPYIIFRRIKH